MILSRELTEAEIFEICDKCRLSSADEHDTGASYNMVEFYRLCLERMRVQQDATR